MTEMQWGIPQMRTAETGVDRGVLYVENSTVGIAWSGLRRVERSSPETDLEPIYFDGYLSNLMRTKSPINFSISAISTPEEFNPCLGKVALAPGFYAENQPSVSFGFSYRTLVANAVEGVSFGYKIHIVFQAYASERPITRQTNSRSPSVVVRNFEVKTIPIQGETFKPVSHISVSSLDLAPDSLSALEDILYGTVSTDPRLPTISEIVDIVS